MAVRFPNVEICVFDGKTGVRRSSRTLTALFQSRIRITICSFIQAALKKSDVQRYYPRTTGAAERRVA
jgi:hypothetical protein